MPDYVRGSGQEIPFGDFAPDKDPTTPGIVLDANYAVPTMKGFAARNSPIAIPNGALLARPLGAYISENSTGFSSLYGYAAGHFYQLEVGGWTEVDASTPYPSIGRVRFAQFNDDVLATANGFAFPVVQHNPGEAFVALGGSPPAKAVTVISVGGFVVFFAGANWYSSAAGVDNNYVPNIQTLAATGTLYDVPGNITAAATLYRSIIAFKLGGTWVGTFSGSPFTWSFQLISGEVGTYGQECVVTLPDSIAFLGTDDFYLTTGYTPQRIPNSIKEWFFANANPQQLANVVGWYDPINSVIYWHFTSTVSPSATTLDRYVAYNVRVGRWSTGYLNCSFVVPNTQVAATGLTAANGGTASGGYLFDTSNNLQSWDSNAGATPGTMYVTTGFMGDNTNLSELLRFRAKWNVKPTFDFGTAYHTNVLGQTPAMDSVVVHADDDWLNCRQYDRYHQVQFNSVGPAEITAYAFQARVGGTR